MTSVVIAKLNRLVSICRESGLGGLTSRLSWRIGGGHRRYLKWKAETDTVFDATHGTETRGIEGLHGFQIIGKNARYGHSHIASDPKLFAEIINGLEIDFPAFTFIDLGSGKGRAIMMAAAYPFRRIIGVEFAAELHRAAETNVATVRNRLPNSRIELIHADAAAYQLPNEPLIIFLFNPFSSIVVRRVAERVIASWRASPRPIYVLYMFPTYLSAFVEAGWQLIDKTGASARLVPASCEG
jgi:hypothetical protein